MIRALIGSVCAILLSGCGSNAQPAKATGKTEKSPTATSTNMPNPHPVAPGVTDNLGSQGGPVELEALTLTAPEGWVRKPASSGFVLSEFTLPPQTGDTWDGRLTVSTAGGDIEANIERWRTQFAGQPAKESRRATKADGLEITIVDLTGDFNDQRGPFAPAVQRSGARMLAAIIPIGSELYFVKAVGPEKTIAGNTEKFDAFVGSLKLKK